MKTLTKKEIRVFCEKVLNLYYSGVLDLTKLSYGKEEADIVRAVTQVAYMHYEFDSNAVDTDSFLPFLEKGMSKEDDLNVVESLYNQLHDVVDA